MSPLPAPRYQSGSHPAGRPAAHPSVACTATPTTSHAERTPLRSGPAWRPRMTTRLPSTTPRRGLQTRRPVSALGTLKGASGICLANVAIRWSFVEMVVELELSGIIPSNQFRDPTPLSLGRVARAAIPASSVRWGAPTPDRPSRSLRSSLCSRYRRRGDGDARVSQVPGGPSCSCPALRPRWDPLRLTLEDDGRCGE